MKGAHDQATVQGLVFSFVSQFVMCPKCNLPETELVVRTKSQRIMHNCAACGARSPVDMSHKLCRKIVRSSKVLKADKKKKKKKAKEKTAKGRKERKKTPKPEAYDADASSCEADSDTTSAVRSGVARVERDPVI